jgi:hypothetical protein
LATIDFFYQIQVISMNDTKSPPVLPDRLSGNSQSPHHVAEIFEHDIGIRLNGKELTNVEEYCISEGWIKIPSPKALDRRGQPLLMTRKGVVEAFYK